MSAFTRRKGKKKSSRFGIDMPQYNLSSSRSSRGGTPQPRTARLGDKARHRKLPFAGDAEAAEKSALNKEDNYIQGEYITNLQQQIYFLELELQVMKEKASSGQFAGKSGIATNAPLDTHMNSLREKYNHMESKYKKKIKNVREDADLMRAEKTKLERENTRLGERIDRMEAQLMEYTTLESELTEKHLGGKLELESKMKRLHLKLGDTDTRLKTKMEEFRQHRASTKSIYLTKDETASDLQRQLDRREEETALHRKAREEAEAKLLEAQEGVELKEEQINELRKEVQKNVDDVIRLEHEVKKKDMDIDRERGAKERFEKELLETRKELDRCEADLRIEKRKSLDIEKSESRWSTTIVELRVSNEQLERDAKELKQQKIDLEQALEKLRDEHHGEMEKGADFQSEHEQLLERLEKLNKSQEELSASMLEREKDNILKADELERMRKRHEKLESEHDEVHKHRDSLHAEVQELKHYRQTADQIKNLQSICDFKQMMTNNLKVAESIQMLHKSLSVAPSRDMNALGSED